MLATNSAVISRSLCLYQCFSLQSIPLKERKAALELKVIQWSPYSDYGTYIIWHGAQAQVWLWKKICEQVSLNYTSETAHYQALKQDGMRIIRCIEGFEAQYWKKNTLLNSHWWPAEPDANKWLRFQQGTGEQPIEKIPTITSLNMALKTWKKGDTFDKQQTLPLETWVWRAIILIPIIAATWTITEIALLKQQLKKVESEKTNLSRQVNPTLLAKIETNNNQQKIKTLARLFNKTTQVEYIDQFLQVFSVKKELLIISWGFVNNSLEIITQSDKLDPSWVVKKITKIDWVDTVNTNSTVKAGQMKITIKIKDI